MSNPTLKQALKPGLYYEVIRGTRCRTLQAGDRLKIVEDGSLEVPGAYGWLRAGEWERFRCPVRLHAEYYRQRIESARAEIRNCAKILGENA